jgi:hypothetical protein
MKVISIILMTTLLSCIKFQVKEPTCRFYCLLSDKYTSDSMYVRTDTLAGNGGLCYVCGADLDSCRAKAVHWYNSCGDYPIQCERYVFNREQSKPQVFK